MGEERDARYAACPYYLEAHNEIQRRQCRIRCEGVSSGNTINLVFGDEKVRDKYKRVFCYSIHKCRECLIHQMLNRKYGVDDDI